MIEKRRAMNEREPGGLRDFIHRSAPIGARSMFILPRLFSFFIIALLFAGITNAQAAGVWRQQRSGTLAWLHAVYFLDAERGWAVGGSGALLATEDGGATWRTKPRPTNDALRDLYFADELNGWLVCERAIYQLTTKDDPRTYLMSTTDGGATWKRVNVIGVDVDARLVRALFAGDGRGWAFGEAGALYATRDHGLTWARQRVPTRHLLLGGTFLDASRGWLVGAGATILQTADGGETWRSCAVMDDGHARFTAISFVDARHGWAVGATGRIYSTSDGGRNWRAQVSNVEADLLDVKFTDAAEGWVCGTEGTLLHTLDGGAHWTIESSGTTHPLERLYFVNKRRGWAVGFGGTIITYDAAAPART
ncbi:MAG TPA: YCF48-related protein, partial [Pyrinomonadaceae bacterium]